MFFVTQASIIRQQLSHRILAQTVVYGLGQTLVRRRVRFVQQVFVQLVSIVLVTEQWDHVAQENIQLQLDCRLIRNVLFVMQASIIQQQLNRRILAQFVRMENGVHKVVDHNVQMIAEQATTAQVVRDQDAALASTQR